MAAPYVGRGATISIGGTALTNPVTIDLPFGTVNHENYMTTTQTDNYVRKMVTSVDPGQGSFEFLYSHADYAVVAGVRGTSTTIVVVTTDTSPKTYTFTGIIKDAKTSMAPDKIVRTTVNFEVAGPIVES